MEDVGTGVMTDDVKIKLAPGDITPVEFGDLDQFAIEARLYQDVPQGPDDAGSTPDQDRRRVVALDGAVVRRTVGPSQILAGRDDEAAPLQRDCPHGGKPGIAVIHRRRAVELN